MEDQNNDRTTFQSDGEAARASGAAQGDPDYLETLARGLHVMLAMSSGGGSISELARTTGLPKPSVRRVVLTLCKLGYAQEKARKYELTPRVTRFATSYLGTAGRSRMLQSFCQSLANKTGEIATVAVADGDEQLHVAFAAPPNFIGIALGVGSRLPTYLTAAGRVFWAHCSDSQIEAFLERTSVTARTPYTIKSKKELKEAILAARQNGYSITDAEYSEEFKSIAYPIYANDGELFGCLTINARKGPSMTDDRFQELIDECRKGAAELRQMISQ